MRQRKLRSFVLAAALAAAAHAGFAQPSGGDDLRVAPAPRVKDVGGSSPGKPQPPISVDYRLSAVPAAGVPLVVTITASADASLGALALDVRAEQGLDVRLPPVAVAAAPGEQAWEVSVTPLSAGRAHLNVLVTSSAAAGSQARSVVVAIDGAPRAKPAAQPLERAERITSLPAKESTRHAAD